MKTFSDVPALSAYTLQRYSLHGEAMGTRYSAVFYAAAGIDEACVNAKLFAEVDRVDRQMSNWKPDSDLNRLNSAPENEWLTMPKELFTVLETALLVSRQSQGAFDIGVGSMVQAWGFGPGKGLRDAKQINALKSQAHRPATEVLELNPAERLTRKRTAITLDLSGIAKGYGVDQLGHCLERLGVTCYLVGIDGEMRARGMKPDGNPWSVAIEKPVRHIREVMGVMTLSDAAIASSGDYRHWVEHEGRSYAHTMNSALQAPVSNRLAAVSVVASSCMLADAWATALLVLGEEAGVKMAQEQGMDAVFVLHDKDGFKDIAIPDGKIEQ